MDPASFTYSISPAQGKKLKALLQEQSFEFEALPYGHFRAAKAKCSIQYYESGKLVLQGKGAKEFIEFYLEPFVLEEARLGYEEELNPEMFEPHFGIDEAGKGDFFGPLVIAGAYVGKISARQLLDAGIKDSKRITSAKRAHDLADQIRKIVGKNCEVVAIFPEKYNELYGKFRNLNQMLAWGHAKVIENLAAKVPGCPRALSDQFAYPQVLQNQLNRKKISIRLEQRTKAEADIAVAAASILARSAFLKGLEKLGEPLERELLKGAGDAVKAQGREIFAQHGEAGLRKIAKEHFKTFGEITGRAVIK
ncbi:MAG: ribonuclease HIII [Methylacidiphilales bacterium]|nr:ribonuclease HIII [Candidatus Methylacidiphilales bacterium]